VSPLDGYLLDGSPAKADAIAAVLADQQPNAFAQPFYRALDLLGARVPDETLMGLRIALAGRRADDDAIRTMRAQIAAARTGDASARAAYLASVETPDEREAF
jgi:hypothetical protein